MYTNTSSLQAIHTNCNLESVHAYVHIRPSTYIIIYIAFHANTLHTHLLKGETNHLGYNLRDFLEVTSHSLLPKLATCNNITTSLWFHICHEAHNNAAKNGVYKSYSLMPLITPFTVLTLAYITVLRMSTRTTLVIT